MRWVMLSAFLIAAVVEILVFVRLPVFGVSLPLVVLLALLVTHRRWLDPAQTLLFVVLALFVVDSVAAARPGSLFLAGLVTILSSIGLAYQLSLAGRLVVPLGLGLYQVVLWFSDGGWLSSDFVWAVAVGGSVSLAAYIFLYFSLKQAEMRL